MLTLCDNPAEKLTDNLWQQWDKKGYNQQPGALTWMEVSNLSKYYVQLCQKNGLDYRDFDFINLVDHTLNYHENKSLITETVGHPEEVREQEALTVLNEKLSEDYGIRITKSLKPHDELEETVKAQQQKIRDLEAQLAQPAEPVIKYVEKPVTVIKEVPVEIIKTVTVTAQPDPCEPVYTMAEFREILAYKASHNHKAQAKQYASKFYRGLKWVLY